MQILLAATENIVLIFNDLNKRHLSIFTIFDEGVKLSNITGMVFAVMKGECLLRHIGFECLV